MTKPVERQGHTETPWVVHEGVAGSGPWDRLTVETEGGALVICEVNRMIDAGLANAAFIVLACNAHDGLVAALIDALALLDRPILDETGLAYNDAANIIRAALKNATERT